MYLISYYLLYEFTCTCGKEEVVLVFVDSLTASVVPLGTVGLGTKGQPI